MLRSNHTVNQVYDTLSCQTSIISKNKIREFGHMECLMRTKSGDEVQHVAIKLNKVTGPTTRATTCP